MERSVVAALGYLMQESNAFHEDVFYEYFRPFRHPSANFDIWGGLGLETFGDDLKLVRDYDENFVYFLKKIDVINSLNIISLFSFKLFKV